MSDSGDGTATGLTPDTIEGRSAGRAGSFGLRQGTRRAVSSASGASRVRVHPPRD